MEDQDYSAEKKLVEAYFLLIHIERMPVEGMELPPAEQLELMSTGFFLALKLNAHCRCISAQEQVRTDRQDQLDSEWTTKQEAHPFLKTSVGLKMMAIEESAALLGVPSIVEEYELPDRIVAIFNRDYMDGEGCSVERPEGDHKFISRLERIAKGLGIQPAKKKSLKCILEKIAGKCGMKVNVEGKTRPKIGKQRVNQYTGVSLVRVMPDIVDDWLVKSKCLGKRVRTFNWKEEHLALELEAMEALEEDWMKEDEEENVQAPLETVATRDCRIERIDAAILNNQLTRMRGLHTVVGTHSESDKSKKSWLDWLDVTDASSVKRAADRLQTVTYTRKECGRRYASNPSYQGCPSGLREMLAKREYKLIDIKSCKPTILLKWAIDENCMGAVLTLRELVEHRDDVYRRIAEFYGVHPTKCKRLVLSLISGGDEKEWIQMAGCTMNETRTAPEVDDMKECYRSLRDAIFRKHGVRIRAMRERKKKTREEKVRQTLATAKEASTSMRKRERKKEWMAAREEATPNSIDRSIFSTLYFEAEDSILDEMDRVFTRGGWKVASLIFDAIMVERRKGEDVGAAMRKAEASVHPNLGYQIELHEEWE